MVDENSVTVDRNSVTVDRNSVTVLVVVKLSVVVRLNNIWSIVDGVPIYIEKN